MKAEIIASGSELLLGELADTNTVFLAANLAALGIDLHFASLVGDNPERYLSVLRQAWERADIIITTGGLGPTRGDITREMVAALVGEEMTVQPELEAQLRSFFNNRGVAMSENNLKQATLIPSASALDNRTGTAPGWWVEKDGRIIIILPGPPIELKDMWQRQVLPRLRAKSGAIILSRTLKTWGLPEGTLDETVAPYLAASNPTLGIYAKADGIHLRITAKAATEKEARRLVAAREEELRTVLGTHIWGADDETLEDTIGEALAARGLTLAVAETLSGGQISRMFTGLADAGTFFRGGIVLPVVAGEAGTARAAAMAADARRQFGADVVVAFDGYCLLENERYRNSAFVHIDTGTSREERTIDFPGVPAQFTRRAITAALAVFLNCLR